MLPECISIRFDNGEEIRINFGMDRYVFSGARPDSSQRGMVADFLRAQFAVLLKFYEAQHARLWKESREGGEEMLLDANRRKGLHDGIEELKRREEEGS
jgi:hypothetical protein